MERLTIRNSDGSVSQPTDLKWAEALEKLAAYEDTGLEPENVLTSLEMADLYATLRKLNEYQEAEAEGRLLILPCRVGDTVWVNVQGSNNFRKATVINFFFDRFGTFVQCEYRNFGYCSCYGRIGKTVFLTREEAAEALRKEQKKEDE